MTLDFTSHDRKQISVEGFTFPAEVDPDVAELELVLNGVPFECDWREDDAVVDGDTWTRDADTATVFAGSDVPTGEIGEATILSGIQYPRLLVKAGPTTVGRDLPPFVVT